MVADVFKGMIGVYAPDTIDRVREHEVKRIGSLIVKIIYDDGSWVETCGGEIVDYSGSENDKKMDPADAYFAGFNKGV